METLKDFIEIQNDMLNDKTINISDLIIIKKNKNGSLNCTTKINNQKVVINYINPKLVKGDSIVVRYGKKDPNWKSDYWYQVDEEEE